MSRGAFSLIELVVVVVILGVIGAIAVPRMSGMASRAKVQGAAGAVQAAQSVIEEYRAIHGSPPASLGVSNFYGKSGLGTRMRLRARRISRLWLQVRM